MNCIINVYREYFLSSIDMNRMKWCGKEYDYSNKLNHLKINDLIFEYFTYFGKKDFNGLIQGEVS